MARDAVQVVDNLRDRMRKQRLKLTQVSTLTDIPYKSLHNYFSHKSEMPLNVYIKICEALNMPLYWPFYGLSPIESSPLNRALQKVFDNILPHVAVGPELQIEHCGEGDDPRPQSLKAGILSGLLAARYSIECAVELDTIDDEAEGYQ